MIDGNYMMQIDTMVGTQTSVATLKTEGDTVFVDIDAPVIGRRTSEGKVDGDTFLCEGAFDVELLGQVAYTLRGEIDGDNLKVVIVSNMGEFNFAGTRM